MLLQTQIDKYNQDGFLNNIRVFDKNKTTLFRSYFDSMVNIENLKNKQITRELHNRHFDQDYVWEVANSPEVLNLIESLIGENILLIGSRFVCKWPGDNTYVPWHQDSRYQKLSPSSQVSVWIAIDDCDIENGCLYIIPETHKSGFIDHKKAEHENALVANEIILSDKDKVVPVELKAGEMAVFHGDIIHGSPANNSDRRRCGLVLRYIPTWVKPEIDGMWPAVLVRGHNNENNFPNLTKKECINFKYLTK